MQTIGTVLKSKGIAAPKLAEMDAEERRDYIARYLHDLRPTAVIQEMLATAQQRSDRANELDFGIEKGHAKHDLERAQWLLKQAEERDGIQATRPEGCGCLGAGGRELRFAERGEIVWGVPCSACPEGREAAARREELRAAYEARRKEESHRFLVGAANIPKRFAECTFKSYPVSEQTRPIVERVQSWATGAEKKGSLLLYGSFGTGKTGLAVSCLRATIEREQSSLFFTVPALLDAIRATYAPDSKVDERKVIDAVKNAPFLVLDDLGAERVTEWVAEKLFTVINHRHDEELPTVFTSNLDMAQLAAHIGERTAWRIVEMAEVVKVDGPNLRVKGEAA